VAEVGIIRNDMNAVATGKARIQELDDQYKARKRRIRQELSLGAYVTQTHSIHYGTGTTSGSQTLNAMVSEGDILWLFLSHCSCHWQTAWTSQFQ
jgi:hypothetical protein